MDGASGRRARRASASAPGVKNVDTRPSEIAQKANIPTSDDGPSALVSRFAHEGPWVEGSGHLEIGIQEAGPRVIGGPLVSNSMVICDFAAVVATVIGPAS